MHLFFTMVTFERLLLIIFQCLILNQKKPEINPVTKRYTDVILSTSPLSSGTHACFLLKIHSQHKARLIPQTYCNLTSSFLHRTSEGDISKGHLTTLGCRHHCTGHGGNTSVLYHGISVQPASWWPRRMHPCDTAERVAWDAPGSKRPRRRRAQTAVLPLTQLISVASAASKK